MTTKPTILVVAAQIEKDGKYLITQRGPHASLPLLWEFPGGRVEDGETDEDAIARELKEEMDIDVIVEEEVVSVFHEYEDYFIDFRVYRCRLLDEQEISRLKVFNFAWVMPDELDNYEFPSADQASIDILLKTNHLN